jgi:Tfp pilus assembly pilus retraction ATPase PilT
VSENRIDRFLKLMKDRGASDLHLSVGRPPIFRLGGRMDPIRYRVLDDNDFTGLCSPRRRRTSGRATSPPGTPTTPMSCPTSPDSA